MASEKVLVVTDKDFQQTVFEADKPVLVDFWAEWCGPCRMIAPVIDEIAAEYDGKLIVAKLNVDENREAASQQGVMSIPTLLLVKDGQVVERIVGFHSKPELMKVINKVLNQ